MSRDDGRAPWLVGEVGPPLRFFRVDVVSTRHALTYGGARRKRAIMAEVWHEPEFVVTFERRWLWWAVNVERHIEDHRVSGRSAPGDASVFPAPLPSKNKGIGDD